MISFILDHFIYVLSMICFILDQLYLHLIYDFLYLKLVLVSFIYALSMIWFILDQDLLYLIGFLSMFYL